MKKIKTIFCLFALLISVDFLAQKESIKSPDGLEWHTDMMKAQELSSASKKPIFAFFTGSDWCVWCIKLQKDVFAKKEFIEWAKKNVVLLELDFPRRKQLSPELVQQNNELQQTFQIQGYPTIWMFFLNKDEKTNKFDIAALGSLGYPPGAEAGKEEVKFLKDANELIKKGVSK
ncbi:MAG: thioredoxin family protein [Bacteroidota bacterium]|nr:thioredoxin family protein [Bacteroidota bacterium]MDP3147251.1 thioredoxin family protein [Bacteroidota bacterium]